MSLRETALENREPPGGGVAPYPPPTGVFRMGSYRAFGTSSLEDFLTNFSHPLNAIKLLTQGYSPREVFDELSKEIEPPDNWVFRLIQLWNLIKGNNTESANSDGSFEPGYNFDMHDYGYSMDEQSQIVVVDEQGESSVYTSW